MLDTLMHIWILEQVYASSLKLIDSSLFGQNARATKIRPANASWAALDNQSVIYARKRNDSLRGTIMGYFFYQLQAEFLLGISQLLNRKAGSKLQYSYAVRYQSETQYSRENPISSIFFLFLLSITSRHLDAPGMVSLFQVPLEIEFNFSRNEQNHHGLRRVVWLPRKEQPPFVT